MIATASVHYAAEDGGQAAEAVQISGSSSPSPGCDKDLLQWLALQQTIEQEERGHVHWREQQPVQDDLDDDG